MFDNENISEISLVLHFSFMEICSVDLQITINILYDIWLIASLSSFQPKDDYEAKLAEQKRQREEILKRKAESRVKDASKRKALAEQVLAKEGEWESDAHDCVTNYFSILK